MKTLKRYVEKLMLWLYYKFPKNKKKDIWKL